MARKTVIMDHNCNRCGRQCKGDISRDKRGSIKQDLLCPGWQEPYEMRTSFLERASEHPGCFTVLNVICKQMNMQFNETTRYPYFTFHLKN